jgi:hypothetical protein
MRVTFFVGVAVALAPLLFSGTFNGLTVAGLVVVALTTVRMIQKEGLE